MSTNITLTVTVPDEQGTVAVAILSRALHEIVRDIPDLISGSLAIFGDDFTDTVDAADIDGQLTTEETQ